MFHNSLHKKLEKALNDEGYAKKLLEKLKNEKNLFQSKAHLEKIIGSMEMDTYSSTICRQKKAALENGNDDLLMQLATKHPSLQPQILTDFKDVLSEEQIKSLTNHHLRFPN